MRRTQKQLEEEKIKYKVFEEGGKWYGFRNCPTCNKEIKQFSNESCVLIRNIRNLDTRNALCATCKNAGEKNPFFGKKHSDKSKKQNSESRKGKACGDKNAMSNPEYRKRVSVALKEKYDSGDLDFLKKIQSENAIKNQANGKLKYAPISNAEKEFRKILESLGYKTEPQFGIGSLRYDIFLTDFNTLIEYNGDYWHCNPNKYKSDYYNKKKSMFAWELWNRDKKKKELAEKNGYKLFTIWESDYKFNKQIEINKIIRNL
jgi:G:T-mismatch repair DNA endonuclease (very short patch repair protein)